MLVVAHSFQPDCVAIAPRRTCHWVDSRSQDWRRGADYLDVQATTHKVLPILGRPALLWRLSHPTHEPAECLVGELADGRVVLRLVQGRKERYETVFDNAMHALHAASKLQQDLLGLGWTAPPADH